MQPHTRKLFNDLKSTTARINGLSGGALAAAEQFTVAPNAAQKLEQTIQESSEFLSRINSNVPVNQQVGQTIGIGTISSLASRTDTRNSERNPANPTDSSEKYRYECVQTNYDSALPYPLLDAWAHRPEFRTIVNTAIAEQQGRDRIMIGFNGIQAAIQTDRSKNPLLQDVNIGWLEKIRKNAEKQHLRKGAGVKIRADGSGDYVNLDALVFDAKTLLQPWYRNRTDLVVLIGDGLIHDKYLRLISTAGDDTQKQVARDILLSNVSLGGLPTYRVPHFPENALLITTFKNLSIYVQNNSRRRQIVDAPRRNQIEDYESVNEAFVVEDYGLCSFVENIDMGDAVSTINDSSSNTSAPTTPPADNSNPAGTETGKTGG